MIDEKKLTEIRRKSQIVAALSLVAFFALIGYSIYKLIMIRKEISKLEQVRGDLKNDVVDLTAQKSDLEKQKRLFQEEAQRSTKSLETVFQSNPQAQQLHPRIYVQINDESQREKANQIANLLQKQNFIIPGIENVGNTKGITTAKTDVRYYTNNPDWTSDINKIKEVLKQSGITPIDRELKDSSPGKIRPRHYELWFGTDF